MSGVKDHADTAGHSQVFEILHADGKEPLLCAGLIQGKDPSDNSSYPEARSLLTRAIQSSFAAEPLPEEIQAESARISERVASDVAKAMAHGPYQPYQAEQNENVPTELPSAMRGVVFNFTSSSFELRDNLPIPSFGPDDILVSMKATGINAIDSNSGLWGSMIPPENQGSFVTGMDCAGESRKGTGRKLPCGGAGVWPGSLRKGAGSHRRPPRARERKSGWGG